MTTDIARPQGARAPRPARKPVCLTALLMLALLPRLAAAQETAPLRPVSRPAGLAGLSADDAEAMAVAMAAAAALPASEDATSGLGPTADMVPAVATPAGAEGNGPAPGPEPDPALAEGEPAGNCPDATPGVVLGPETCKPLPRFVSLKTEEGNARRGPSLSHRIDWVFVREDMPLMVTAEYGHWRRVVDRDGVGGWVHYSLLSGNRTALVTTDLQPLFARAEDGAAQVAQLEIGVLAEVDSCNPDWCRIEAGGYDGWIPKAAIWGVGAAEVLD